MFASLLIVNAAFSQETTATNNGNESNAEKVALREKAKALQNAVENDKAKWESIQVLKDEHKKKYVKEVIYPNICKILFKKILDAGEDVRKMLSISEETDAAEFFAMPVTRFEQDIIDEVDMDIDRRVDEAMAQYKKDLDKERPMYKVGEMVTISTRTGTKKGIIKRIGENAVFLNAIKVLKNDMGNDDRIRFFEIDRKEYLKNKEMVERVNIEKDKASSIIKLHLSCGYLPINSDNHLDFTGRHVGWIARKELCDAICRQKTEAQSVEIGRDFKEKLPSLLGFKNKDGFDEWKAKMCERLLELGICYMNGGGVKKNLTSGFQCFEAAMNFGNAEAITNVGLCYHWGKGVAYDSAKAFNCFTQASEMGNNKAKFYLGFNYYNGWNNTTNKLKAVELWKEAASNGDAYSSLQLGLLYYEGNVVSKDFNKAFQYFSKAADKDIPLACYQLSICYSSGNGVVKDEMKAFEYLSRAAEKNLPQAQKDLPQAEYKLGTSYENGLGVEKDWEVALKLYEAAKCGLDRKSKMWSDASQAYSEVKRKLELLAEIMEQDANENQSVEESDADRKKRLMAVAEKKREAEIKRERELAKQREQEIERQLAEERERQYSSYSSYSSRGRVCADCGGSGKQDLRINGKWYTVKCDSCSGTGNAGYTGDYIEGGRRRRSQFDQDLGRIMGTGGGGGIFGGSGW